MKRFGTILGLPFVTFLIAGQAWAAPILIDLGPNRIMTGVSRDADGATYLVGVETDPSTGSEKGILTSIAANSGTPVTTVLGVPAEFRSTFASGIRGNYIVGGGFTRQTQGLAWTVDDPGTAIGVEPIPYHGRTDTFLNGVNSRGQFAGDAVGATFAITGQVGGATLQLPMPPTSGGYAADVSDRGTIVGVVDNLALDGLHATAWTATGDIIELPNPFVFSGNIRKEAVPRAISPDDTLIGGFVGIFDEISEQIREAAAVWSGDAWSDLTVLTDPAGKPLWGEVLGVTDDGYAVGRSAGGGFIWHTSWDHARMFNTWAVGEFGMSIPTWVTSVNDVFSDGTDLNFALQGSAYYFRAPVSSAVPEPGTLLLSLCVVPAVLARRIRG